MVKILYKIQGSTKVGYNGPPLCRPKHVPNSLVMHLALMPLHCSPAALDDLLCSGAKFTNAMKKHLRGRERERTEAIKSTCLGE